MQSQPGFCSSYPPKTWTSSNSFQVGSTKSHSA